MTYKNVSAWLVLAILAGGTASVAAEVKMWSEQKNIPTYEVLPADPNPRFMHDRGNQGSKGNVYPHPILDRLSDKKIDKSYTAVYLENEYLKVMVLPEIGGRVHSITDKTNGAEVIYEQQVIKPALIGLFGPWCSGGIEFCFPQHHRPTTFDPVDWTMQENSDGSKTVWVGETDPLYRIRGMAGVTLHPGKSYVEVKIYIYNESFIPKSFLWWANVGVNVNENCQVIFPPDVNYVTFHGKSEVVPFPVPGTSYQGMDYAKTDISWLKNIMVPTSYFAGVSTNDFVGIYDHGAKTGMLHIADHGVSPGKKCWTWGNGIAGKIWEKNLTDNDGPYVEIMAGVFTDNQPDFSWIKPFEVKRTSQYWYPLRNIGYVKNANINAAINLQVQGRAIKVAANTTAQYKNATFRLFAGDNKIAEEKIDIAPGKPFAKEYPLPQEAQESSLKAILYATDNKELVSFSPENVQSGPLPKPFEQIPDPKEIKTIDNLLIDALHIDQYKTPARDPDPLYLEVLARDPENSEANNALGLLAMRQGDFAKAEKYLRMAAARAVAKNQNPYNTEPFFNLGALQVLQGKTNEAIESFNKCLWDASLKSAASYALARLICARGDLPKALHLINNSLEGNNRNPAALCLKSAILRKLGQAAEAKAAAMAANESDVLFFWAYSELGRKDDMKKLMRGQAESYIDVAQDYAEAGMWEDAAGILRDFVALNGKPDKVYPMAYYYLAYYTDKLGKKADAADYYALAAKAAPDFCFPARLTDIAVLEAAKTANPGDARACYYLGNLWYDKKQFEPAIQNWEKAKTIEDKYWIVNRNLGFAYNEYNKDQPKAIAAYEKALAQNKTDITTLNELYMLYKETKVPQKKRLSFLDKYNKVVDGFDVLTVHKLSLQVQLGKYDQALEVLNKRLFHPWEGNAFSLHKLYETACLMKGLEAVGKKKYDQALVLYEAALASPENLRDEDTPDNPFYYAGHVYYYLAMACEGLGMKEKAQDYFNQSINARAADRASESGYFKGMALLKTGKEAEAKNEFAMLIEKGKNMVESSAEKTRHGGNPVAKGWYLQGLGLAGQGNTDKAKEAFAKVLELDMDNLDAQLALKGL